MLVENPAQLRNYQPVMQPVQGPDLIDSHDVMQEALELRAQLRTANRDQTREVLEKLRCLSSRISGNGRRARRSAGIVQSSITQAQQQLETLSDEANYLEQFFASQKALELCVYVAMSKPAQEFYHAIEQKTYHIAPVTRAGVVSVGEKREVEGEQLRHEFSMIKYHSMTEVEKRSMLNEALRMNESAELVSNNPDYLIVERKAVAELHGYLRNMEAYKAYRNLTDRKGRPLDAMLEIAREHDDFMRAHAAVDDLLRAYDRLILHIYDAEAIEDFKATRSRMKRILKEDIMERVLLDGDSASETHGSITPPITPVIREAETQIGKPD